MKCFFVLCLASSYSALRINDQTKSTTADKHSLHNVNFVGLGGRSEHAETQLDSYQDMTSTQAFKITTELATMSDSQLWEKIQRAAKEATEFRLLDSQRYNQMVQEASMIPVDEETKQLVADIFSSYQSTMLEIIEKSKSIQDHKELAKIAKSIGAKHRAGTREAMQSFIQTHKPVEVSLLALRLGSQRDGRQVPRAIRETEACKQQVFLGAMRMEWNAGCVDYFAELDGPPPGRAETPAETAACMDSFKNPHPECVDPRTEERGIDYPVLEPDQALQTRPNMKDGKIVGPRIPLYPDKYYK